MTIRYSFWLFCCCLYLNTNYAQSPATLLTEYTNSFHTEKIYISHNQPYYVTGETIWCKLYVVDGQKHQFLDAQPIVYVDWFNPKGEIVRTYNLQVINGTATLDISTDKNDLVGNYTLRAYTLYQKNFDEAYLFQKQITLTNSIIEKEEDHIDKNLDFSVQFFPEGGDLVVGLKSKVAFKAQDEKGNNITIKGEVVDGLGNKVGSLTTLQDGMGFFNLTPAAKETYTAVVNYNNQKKNFQLPQALSKGHLLKINTRPNDFVVINLLSNTTNYLKDCQLIGHLRGQVFYTQDFEEQAKSTLSIRKMDLPTGLLHFTLFDNKNRPVSERLIFNQNKAENATVQLTMQDSIFSKRAVVTGSIKVEQADKWAAANMSMTVYHLDLLGAQVSDLTIENYLLLQADLKGRIDNINQYFKKEDGTTRTLLDLLLATHGWRRFTWQQILDKEKIDLPYPVEETFSLSGQIKKFNKDRAVKANVFVNVLDRVDFSFSNITTGEEGLFYFDGFSFKDTTDLLIQANIYNEKKLKKVPEGMLKRVGNKEVDITLFQLQELPLTEKWTIESTSLKQEAIRKYVKEIMDIKGEEIIDESLWTLDLDAVTVKEKKLNYRQIRRNNLKDKYKEKGIFHFSSTDKFFTEDLFKYTPKFVDIFDLIATAIPNATISISKGDLGLENTDIPEALPAIPRGQKLILLNPDKEAAFAVDGNLVSPIFINEIQPETVESIELLTGPKANALYGQPTVIMLLLKEGAERTKAISDAQNIGMMQYEHPGFYQAKTFYTPTYAQNLPAHKQPDYRTTLHWEASIESTNLATDFQFYTGDITGKYLLFIEGLTERGVPFVAQKTIEVQ